VNIGKREFEKITDCSQQYADDTVLESQLSNNSDMGISVHKKSVY